MSLFVSLSICVSSFIFLHTWQVRWRAHNPTSAAQAGLRAGLEYLRTVTLIATTTYTLLFVAIALAGFLRPVTLTDLAATIRTVHDLRDSFAQVGGAWSLIVLASLLVALVLFARSRGVTKWDRQAAIFRTAELKRVHAARAAKMSPVLPPTPQMYELLLLHQQLHHRLMQIASAPSDPAAHAQADKLRSQLETIQRRLDALDLERRIRPFRGEGLAHSTREDATTLSGRLRTFFVSRGLLSALDGGSKTVLRLGLVLLCLSLVGVVGGPLRSAADQVLIRLETLYLETSEREALDSYARAAPPELEPHHGELSADDEQTIDFIATQFERSVGRALAARRAPSTGRAAAELGRLLARHEILRNATNAAGSAFRPTLPALSQVPDLRNVEQETLALLESATNPQRPQTEVGRRFRNDLETRFVRRASSSWTSFKDRAQAAIASFRTSASPEEFERRVLTQIFGQALDVTGPPASELGTLARELSRQVGSGSIPRLYAVFSAQALDDLAAATSVTEAFDGLVERQRAQWDLTPRLAAGITAMAESIPSPDGILSRLPVQPSGLYVPANVESSATQLAEAVAEYNRISRAQTAWAVPEAVADFDDYFPADNNSVTRTLQQQVGSTLASRAGVAVAQDFARAMARDQSRRLARSRSFGRLRGFHRVGGVLLGRPPENPEQRLDVRSFEWTDDGPHHIALELTDGRGNSFRTAAFSRALVHQALTYAADGRPVAVTMTTAAPLKELRILLHPALVDTPLGCRFIDLDGFVDEFTGDNPLRRDMGRFVEAQVALYKMAWVHRVMAAEQQGLMRVEQDDLDLIGPLIRDVLLSPAISDAADRALEGVAQLRDADYSLLGAKPEHFDPELVGAMAECGAEGESIDDFQTCIGPTSLRLGRPSETWLQMAPEFVIWSGVREQAYSLDENYRFLEIGQDGVAPLEFMLQVAFVDEEEDDLMPWTFPGLTPTIQRLVEAGARSSAEHLDVLETTRRFAVLQRLFRAALDGALGDQFPIQSLVELAHETAGDVPAARTLRWNVRPGVLEFTLARELDIIVDSVEPATQWQEAAMQDIVSCWTFIMESEALTAVDAMAWRRACDLSAFRAEAAVACGDGQGDEGACYLEIAAMLAEQTAVARDIREALGVRTDEEAQRRRADGCPPMIPGG